MRERRKNPKAGAKRDPRARIWIQLTRAVEAARRIVSRTRNDGDENMKVIAVVVKKKQQRFLANIYRIDERNDDETKKRNKKKRMP
jgi:head-tail adaptor